MVEIGLEPLLNGSTLAPAVDVLQASITLSIVPALSGAVNVLTVASLPNLGRCVDAGSL